MSSRKLAAAVTFAALFSLTAPAHAATIITDYIDLIYGNGYTIVGDYSVDYSKFATASPPPLYYDGLLVSDSIFSPGNSGTALYLGGSSVVADLSVPYPYYGVPPISDFALNGVQPASGVVYYVGDIQTPLPDALPMFGAAMIGLGGFAAWRSRQGIV